MHKKLPVLVDAGLHLHQLRFLELKGVEAGHQPLEAPRAFEETRVFDDVEPHRAVDVDQKLDGPHQLLIMRCAWFCAAVHSEIPAC